MSITTKEVQALREPGEKRLLHRTCLLLGLAYLIATGLTLSAFLVWFAIAAVTIRVLRSRYLSEAIEISPDQLPEVMLLVGRCSKDLGCAPPRVFITVDPGTWPVYTVPVPEPAILLQARWIDILRDDELAFFIYHEMAHSSLGHRWLMNPINVLENVGPVSWVLTTPIELARFCLRPWLRLAEFSADRVALTCVGGDLDVVARALSKVTAGEDVCEMISPAAYVDQARRLRVSRLLSIYEILTGKLGPARRLARLMGFLETEQARLMPPVPSVTGRFRYLEQLQERASKPPVRALPEVTD
jgi:Zn-dependent protease with chaperone function